MHHQESTIDLKHLFGTAVIMAGIEVDASAVV
jgi:hypothetical protein